MKILNGSPSLHIILQFQETGVSSFHPFHSSYLPWFQSICPVFHIFEHAGRFWIAEELAEEPQNSRVVRRALGAVSLHGDGEICVDVVVASQHSADLAFDVGAS